jgi:hypothetical protein
MFCHFMYIGTRDNSEKQGETARSAAVFPRPMRLEVQDFCGEYITRG